MITRTHVPYFKQTDAWPSYSSCQYRFKCLNEKVHMRPITQDKSVSYFYYFLLFVFFCFVSLYPFFQFFSGRDHGASADNDINQTSPKWPVNKDKRKRKRSQYGKYQTAALYSSILLTGRSCELTSQTHNHFHLLLDNVGFHNPCEKN